MLSYNELLELAYKKYPLSSLGFVDGELLDGNSSARRAYVQGFEDGMRYVVDEIKGKHDETGGE